MYHVSVCGTPLLHRELLSSLNMIHVNVCANCNDVDTQAEYVGKGSNWRYIEFVDNQEVLYLAQQM